MFLLEEKKGGLERCGQDYPGSYDKRRTVNVKYVKFGHLGL